ncbi:glycosyl hydrolase family 65 protein [Butyrivibrio sp. MC2013]|uniref:glycosyl hydrolase family 65 protein n=1 Tax=Butyrivibrio sp. MC2013 TaxID=1280686 RepID=UPI0004136656|nr:glycosyl hydrolase family 65 protein [Butyrivibrio sp. MC2013]
MDKIIYDNGYDRKAYAALGNRFLIGNGLVGIRGTLEEYTADLLPAINLAGVYDKVENFREPVNLPNALYSYIKVDGNNYRLPDLKPASHKISLDYGHGIFMRSSSWTCPRGNICLETRRIASMDDVNLIVMELKVSADFHAEAEIYTGIDTDIWDLNGRHLEDFSIINEDIIHYEARTHEEGIRVVMDETIEAASDCEITSVREDGRYLHRISFITRPGEAFRIVKYISFDTSKTAADPVCSSADVLKRSITLGYEEVMDRHMSVWDRLWDNADVEIKGNDEANTALNYSLYHLMSIAPRHADNLSIPARGLSGQTYRGAVFWDTEMFMLDFFIFTEPDTARKLIKYRIDTLPGAMKKAAHYGYKGAFYAWESQEGGFDACSDYNVIDVFTGRPMRTYFKDKQVHISAAIVYGLCRYLDWTGDMSLLDDGGAEMIMQCALFYLSILVKSIFNDYYEIRDVIGPDEYHERVNNNVYTNRMAKYVFEKAAKILREGYLDISDSERDSLIEGFEDGAKHILIKKPDENGIIPQFDGYEQLEDASLADVRSRLLNDKEYWGGAYGVASDTRIIKQADVVTMLNLFADDYSLDTISRNWSYYEPRTEHGSSLSAGMYSLLACKIGNPGMAWPFFLKSARADLSEKGKEWAGLLYIGGTHPAAAGAAYMIAVEGFAGLSVKNGELTCNPSLPKEIEEISFKIFYKQQQYSIRVSHDSYSIDEIN